LCFDVIKDLLNDVWVSDENGNFTPTPIIRDVGKGLRVCGLSAILWQSGKNAG
jgi:hypothetical protein